MASVAWGCPTLQCFLLSKFVHQTAVLGLKMLVNAVQLHNCWGPSVAKWYSAMGTTRVFIKGFNSALY